MTEPTKQPRKRRPYGRFAIAVMIYVIGVAAFSTWSYLEHSNATAKNTAVLSEHQRESINKIAVIEVLEGVFLLVMAFPLIGLYHRARTRSSHQVEKLNAQLQRDFQKIKKHETELEDAIHDLERFNAVATGREQRIVELKNEVNTLLQELNRASRYNTSPIE